MIKYVILCNMAMNFSRTPPHKLLVDGNPSLTDVHHTHMQLQKGGLGNHQIDRVEAFPGSQRLCGSSMKAGRIYLFGARTGRHRLQGNMG